MPVKHKKAQWQKHATKLVTSNKYLSSIINYFLVLLAYILNNTLSRVNLLLNNLN